MIRRILALVEVIGPRLSLALVLVWLLATAILKPGELWGILPEALQAVAFIAAVDVLQRKGLSGPDRMRELERIVLDEEDNGGDRLDSDRGSSPGRGRGLGEQASAGRDQRNLLGSGGDDRIPPGGPADGSVSEGSEGSTVDGRDESHDATDGR